MKKTLSDVPQGLFALLVMPPPSAGLPSDTKKSVEVIELSASRRENLSTDGIRMNWSLLFRVWSIGRYL
jgi:hypothetical protein